VPAGGAVTSGGLAITAPAGGLLAIAGGATTTRASCRGCGTIRLGAGVAGAASATRAAAAAGAACAVPGPAALAAAGEAATTPAVGLVATAGATAPGFATTVAGRAGGWLLAIASACLRSRIAFSASPGFEIWLRLNAGLCSPEDFAAAPPPRRPFRYSRTRSASPDSIELECVFGSVTPTAVRASRMDRLLTSSSRARSLIRTLLIRPFSFSLTALAVHFSLFEVGIFANLYYPRISNPRNRRFETRSPVSAENLRTSTHGRARPRQSPHRISPGSPPPAGPWHRCPVQSLPLVHLHP
jgi:hypothetical protein